MSDFDFNADSFSSLIQKIENEDIKPITVKGQITQLSGNLIRANMPDAVIGELVEIINQSNGNSVKAQVIGFNGDQVFLTPFDHLTNIGPNSQVVSCNQQIKIPVGKNLLGRVIDSLGEPIDNLGPIESESKTPITSKTPKPFDRKRILTPLSVGISSIDGLNTVGEGQRIGIFSTAGVGKSTLLGMIARNSEADVIVIGLVGERGREVRDFIEDSLGIDGLKKSVLVVATSEETSLRRVTAAYSATAVAEYFRDQGKKVLLLIDSVTRYARALREISLSAGEPPARQGFPPSVFSTMPQLFERAGLTNSGSITAFYTVLLQGENIEDPIGEEIKALLDGHLLLSQKLSNQQIHPAIDILASTSRVMGQISKKEDLEKSALIKQSWANYEENRDLILLGAYREGSDHQIDRAIKLRPKIIDFIKQDPRSKITMEETIKKMEEILS